MKSRIHIQASNGGIFFFFFFLRTGNGIINRHYIGAIRFPQEVPGLVIKLLVKPVSLGIVEIRAGFTVSSLEEEAHIVQSRLFPRRVSQLH